MPPMERQLPVAAVKGTSGLAEPGQTGADIFGRRRVEANFWQPQDPWLSQMLSPPQSERQEEAGPTILASTEVSLERISLSSGPAVIEISDEQAQRIIDSYGEDAYPPQ
jgi:hypothetical protein